MYRAGLESLLGLRRRGARFSVNPCIPASWATYTISWRFLSTQYEITVTNPQRRCQGSVRAELDGLEVDADAIPLVDDGCVHQVSILMGGDENTESQKENAR